MAPVPTFPALLDRRLAADPGQPLLTFYDETSCRVTIHLERSALIALMQRLLTDPDPPPSAPSR